MRKATHQGHCQVCGHFQKLPNGRMAKHGYNVQFGFFSGTCSGSDYLPFELSIDRIERAIAEVTETKSRLQASIVNLNEQQPTDKIWVNQYFPATWEFRHSYHVWGQLEVVVNQAGEYSYLDRKGEPEPFYRSGIMGDLQKACNDQALRYAQHLAQQVNQIDEYVFWQRDRIKDWKASDLIPLK